MATAPAFAATPVVSTGSITAATTVRDGTGAGLVTVFTAGSSGSRIERVTVTSSGTTTAATVTLFLFNGTTTVIVKEIAVTAVTPNSTGTAGFWAQVGLGMVLPSGYVLKAGVTAITASTTVFVTAEGSNF